MTNKQFDKNFQFFFSRMVNHSNERIEEAYKQMLSEFEYRGQITDKQKDKWKPIKFIKTN